MAASTFIGNPALEPLVIFSRPMLFGVPFQGLRLRVYKVEAEAQDLVLIGSSIGSRVQGQASLGIGLEGISKVLLSICSPTSAISFLIPFIWAGGRSLWEPL